MPNKNKDSSSNKKSAVVEKSAEITSSKSGDLSNTTKCDEKVTDKCDSDLLKKLNSQPTENKDSKETIHNSADDATLESATVEIKVEDEVLVLQEQEDITENLNPNENLTVKEKAESCDIITKGENCDNQKPVGFDNSNKSGTLNRKILNEVYGILIVHLTINSLVKKQILFT